jgi:hypothetical protein
MGDIGEAVDCASVEDAGVQALLFVPGDMVTDAGPYPGLDMVCGHGDGPIWNCRAQGYCAVETEWRE